MTSEAEPKKTSQLLPWSLLDHHWGGASCHVIMMFKQRHRWTLLPRNGSLLPTSSEKLKPPALIQHWFANHASKPYWEQILRPSQMILAPADTLTTISWRPKASATWLSHPWNADSQKLWDNKCLYYCLKQLASFLAMKKKQSWEWRESGDICYTATK
jgi:hypothetical protein